MLGFCHRKPPASLPNGAIGAGFSALCEAAHSFSAIQSIVKFSLTIRPLGRPGAMQQRNEADDKTKALRTQLDLCRRLAHDIGDPDMAEKLRNLIKKMEAQTALQSAA